MVWGYIITAALRLPWGHMIGALLRMYRAVVMGKGMRASEPIGWLNRILLIVSFAYLVFPIDFIPDAIPIIGYLDDLIVILLLVGGIVKAWNQRDVKVYVHDECCICLEPKVEVTFKPCMHACCCKDCASKVKVCPLDRTPIRQREDL
ncbi:hypothetical protein Pelo_2669 [Pelomyxa schiedti]|nr:hypothetical protein Pelo_2669 [Pelomyxa schiedti]